MILGKTYLNGLENKIYLGTTLIYPTVDTTSFTIQIQTDLVGTSNNDQFTIPAVGTYDIDWGDGVIELGLVDTQTHTYSVAGTYDVSVSGGLEQILFANGGDKLKLTDIKQWGDIAWTIFDRSFYGCNNLIGTATDTPDLSSVENTFRAFRDCKSMVLDVSAWDVSNVTSFNNTFNNCDAFDSDLSGWDINQVTTFLGFMVGATGLSTPNYDSTLISWANQAPLSNKAISFGGSKYTLGGAAEAARQELIDTYLWTITDGGGI